LKAGDVIQASEERRAEAREERENAKAQAKLKRDMERTVAVLKGRPEGETLTALTNAAGISRDRGRAAVAALADMATIVPCKITKGNNQRELDGYRIPPDERVDRDK
jgi:hypothetical protein